MTTPRLTVIIPAFNEEATITATLDRLVEQSAEIAEIIVVDNNSTDRTAEIVQNYQSSGRRHASDQSPQIRLIRESRPGVAYARNAGLDASTSELTARLDADTIPSAGWARAIREYFATAHRDVALATGPMEPYDSPFRDRFARSNRSLIKRARSASSDPRGSVGLAMAPGANSVLRTDCWRTLREETSQSSDLYEDLDLSLCVREAGWRIGFIYDMEAATSARRFRSSPRSYHRYLRQLPATYRAHGDSKQARRSYFEVMNNQLVHLVTWLPTRGFDPETGKVSLRRMFARIDEADTGRH